MRLLLLSLFLASPALAQEVGQDLWMSQEATSIRFAGEEVAGPAFDERERVKVLYVQGDQVRVRAGNDYGWLPSTALTAEAPATTEPLKPTGAPGADFDLEALKKMLDEKSEL